MSCFASRKCFLSEQQLFLDLQSLPLAVRLPGRAEYTSCLFHFNTYVKIESLFPPGQSLSKGSYIILLEFLFYFRTLTQTRILTLFLFLLFQIIIRVAPVLPDKVFCISKNRISRSDKQKRTYQNFKFQVSS